MQPRPHARTSGLAVPRATRPQATAMAQHFGLQRMNLACSPNPDHASRGLNSQSVAGASRRLNSQFLVGAARPMNLSAVVNIHSTAPQRGRQSVRALACRQGTGVTGPSPSAASFVPHANAYQGQHRGVPAALPNPSLKLSPNGGPRGPGRRYGVHFRQPGPRVPPSVPA